MFISLSRLVQFPFSYAYLLYQACITTGPDFKFHDFPGWVGGGNENKANSAQLELELGLSLAIMPSLMATSLRWRTHSAWTNCIMIALENTPTF